MMVSSTGNIYYFMWCLFNIDVPKRMKIPKHFHVILHISHELFRCFRIALLYFFMFLFCFALLLYPIYLLKLFVYMSPKMNSVKIWDSKKSIILELRTDKLLESFMICRNISENKRIQ